MSKSLWSRSVWNSLFNRATGSRRPSRRRSNLRTNWKNGQISEALEQRVVLAAVAVSYDGSGTLTLLSTAGATNEVVSVKAGATFTDVLVGGKLVTRVVDVDATSSTLHTVIFDGRGGTDTLNISGINNTGTFTVTLTDVEKLQLNATAVTTEVTSTTAADSNLTLVTSTVTGALDITHDGAIVQSGKLLVSGLTTIAAGAGTKNITLGTASNSFGDLALTGNNITLKEAGPTTFDGTIANGTLTVTSTGSISNGNAGAGTLTVNGTGAVSLTSSGSSIDLDAAFVTTGAVSLKGTNIDVEDTSGGINLNAVTAVSNFTLETSDAAGGAVTQTSSSKISVGALAIIDAGTAFAGGSNITLNGASATNNFGSLDLNGATINIKEKSATDLREVDATGSLTIVSSGAITDSGDVDVTGTTSLTASSAAITLDFAGSTYGNTITFTGTNVAITDSDGVTNLGTSTAKGTLNLTTTGSGVGVIQSGNLTVSGLATVTANSATATNGINLATGTNKFGSIALFTNRNATIAESDASDIATSTITENFVLTSGGAVTDSGAIAVTGSTTISNLGVAAAGKSITLNDTSSSFVGQINLNPTGAGVSTTSAAALTNTVASVLGNIQLKTFNLTAGGSVSQNAGTDIDVTGLAVIDAAGSTIELGVGTETLDLGSISLFGTTVDVEENSGTDLAVSTITGDFNLDSNGNVTDSGSVNVTGTTDIDASPGATDYNITLDSSGSTYGVTATVTDLVLNGKTISVFDGSDETKLGTITATAGALTVTSNGPITDAAGATIIVTGSNKVTFNAIGDDITINNLTNQFTGAISLIGEDATLTTGATADGTGANVVLGTSNVQSLTITLAENGNLTDSGVVKVLDALSVNIPESGVVATTATIDLDSTLNTFGEINITTARSANFVEFGDTLLGLINVTGAAGLTVTASGAIEDKGPGAVNILNIDGELNLTANGGDLTLQADSTFAGVVNLIGTNVEIKNVDAVGTNLGDVTATGTFQLNSTGAGAVSQSGAAIVGDLATIVASAGTADISLTGDNQFGRISFNGATVTINETDGDGTLLSELANATDGLTLTSLGSITSDVAVTVVGTTHLNAGFGASNDESITLTEVGNNFDTLELIGGAVTIDNDDTAGTALGASTVDSLTLTSAGDVTQAGDVSVANALTITADNTASTTANDAMVTLGDTDNLEVGSISITAGDATITETSADGVILGAITLVEPDGLDLVSTATGSLVLTSTGDVTNNGTLIIEGSTTITAYDAVNTTKMNIILDHTDIADEPDNVFGNGALDDFVMLDGAMIEVLAESGLHLGNITATGDVDLTAGGDVENDVTGGKLDIDGVLTINAGDHDITIELVASESDLSNFLVTNTTGTVDTTIPTSTIELDDITADNVINSTEAGANVLVKGTVGGNTPAQATDTVDLYVDGVVVATGTVADFTGAGISVAGSDLAGATDPTVTAIVTITTTTSFGIYTPTEATDAQSYTVDTTAPAAPTIDSVTDSNATPNTVFTGGSLAAADQPFLFKVSLNGAGATAPVAGDTVNVYDNSGVTVVGTAVLTATDITNDFVNVSVTGLSAGAGQTFTSKVTDQVGNEGAASAVFTLTVT